jgi:acetyl-CoA acetyltransferase
VSGDQLRAAVAIIGVGLAGCGEAQGRTDMEILAEAAGTAIHDAGLKIGDIDGLATASSAFLWGLGVSEYLGIRPRFVDTTMLGGSSFVAHMEHAALALAAGRCNAVLVCYGSTARTRPGPPPIQASHYPYEHPYQPFSPPVAYALAAARHMHLYGTTREQLAEVAVAARAWARLNPEAFMREALTISDVLNARMVADPLTVRDCCLVTDGAGAFVMIRAERAAELRSDPVYLLGIAAEQTHRQISSMPDLTVTCARESGARAFSMAGLGPTDIDVLQLYDAFTINPILFLEDLGFCEKGEGGAFVAGGGIAPGGRLPVNTNGGGLSCVHPGMYGVFAVIEAVRQLRGECGERQVARARSALVHGNGGVLSSEVTAILSISRG